MELLSRPEDWQTNADALARTAKRDRNKRGEGREAVRALFGELEAAGYIVRTKTQTDGGSWITELTVFDIAQDVTSDDAQSPSSDRGTGNRASVNQASADRASVNQASLRRTGDGSTDTKDSSTKDYSSSSAEVEDITHEVTPPAPKKKKIETSSNIISTRLTNEQCTTVEADKVAAKISAEGDGQGGPIRFLPTWVTNRDINTLRDDLMFVRGLQKPAGASTSGWSWEDQLRSERRSRGGHTPYKNPVDQSVYDEPLLVPTTPTDF